MKVDDDLVREIEDPSTLSARIPYAMMELTAVAPVQIELEATLLRWSSSSQRSVIRAMSAECMGQMVRERRQLVSDAIPLRLCELLSDDDEVVRTNASESMHEVEYWLSRARRGGPPLPTDSIVHGDRAVYLAADGVAHPVAVGHPDDPAVKRLTQIIGECATGSALLAAEILAALNLGRASGAGYFHIDDDRHVRWYAWAFEKTESRSSPRFVPPRLVRVPRLRVSARNVKSFLKRTNGAALRLRRV